MKTRAIALALLAAACAGAPSWHGTPSEPPVPGLVAPKRVASTPEDDISPSASPSGRYLAFASEQNGNLDIWVRDQLINSTYPVTRHSAEDFDPEISPDGRRLAFVSRREDAKGDVFVKAIGDESDDGLQPLTDSETADRQPVWSPDGRVLYFSSTPAIGLESVSAFELEPRRVRRVSPTAGFDPAPAPDPRYLVYTAARGVEGHEHPRLVLLRLSDSATRAITRGEAPEGFARFAPAGPGRLGGGAMSLVYVRFADDDDGNGVIDASDQASLWRLDFPDGLEVFFSREAASHPEPVPLTDGLNDELFPDISESFVYFTQGGRQQDIMRLPLSGMFPDYDDPRRYLGLAEIAGDLRTRWFVFRRMLAAAPAGSLLQGQALLRIGNLQLERERPDLARGAFQDLSHRLAAAPLGTPEAELVGLARAEISSLDRVDRLARSSTPIDRERVLRTTERELAALEGTYAESPRVRARLAIERAEVLLERGERPRAIDALDAVVRDFGCRDEASSPAPAASRRGGCANVPFSAARAMLRRIELLEIAHDADALGEAYAEVVSRFPDQREAVRQASERIVRAQVAGLGARATWRSQADALRRTVARFEGSPVRAAARWKLVELLKSRRAFDEASLELQRLVDEAGADRVGAARALVELAQVDEERGRLDEALGSWRKLASAYGDLPGAAADARDAITRVGTLRAEAEEARGNKVAARAAYAEILDNDVTQVNAHRKFLALSAETGELQAAVEAARARAERSPLTPVARYAYGLALTWQSPPALDEALEEIDRALALNPRFVHAYITRGWIHEMKELERPGWLEKTARNIVRGFETALTSVFPFKLTENDWLELALEDYDRALRLNPESEDPATELEIMLDGANAKYRLAEKTNDSGGFKAALATYVECLNADMPFQSPVAEMVFFERLGRAATWMEDWALSVMATRRALALAEKTGRLQRVAQLYGTLSIAYAQAGEDDYARLALETSEAQLEARNLEARLVVARRNRAAVKLATLEARTPEVLDGALEDLASARALAEDSELGHADAPVWVATVADASSAQYGFGDLAERDVNLALAGAAHRAQGEVSRAEAIAERRRLLTAELEDSVGTLLFSIRREPWTLLNIRERVGLDVQRAEQLFDRGEVERADAVLREVEERLSAAVADEALRSAWPQILADRARVVALRAERRFIAPVPRVSLRSIEEALDSNLVALESAFATGSTVAAALPEEDEVLARLPITLSSTGALSATASVALSAPRLDAARQEVRAAKARLHHARGLLALAAEDPSAPAGDLRGLLMQLDQRSSRRVGALADARRRFESAAREAAGAGPGLGARVLIAALVQIADATRALGDRGPNFVEAARATARELARAVGRDDLALRVQLEAALRGEPEALEGALAAGFEVVPAALGSARRAFELALTRTASAALAEGRVADAFTLVDRRMLLQTAGRPGVGIENAIEPGDQEVSRRFGTALGALSEARQRIARLDASRGRAGLDAERRAFEAARSHLGALRSASMTDAAKARLLGEPVLFDLLVDNVRPREALLVVAPIGETVNLLLVDGSTTATSAMSRIHAFTSRISTYDLREAIASSRRALERDQPAPPDALARLREALFQPLGDALQGVDTLFLADVLIGGPIPTDLGTDLGGLGHPDLVHVSAPSAFAASRAAELVGAVGTLVVRAAGEVELSTGDEVLDAQDALGFRFRPKTAATTGPAFRGGPEARTRAEQVAGRPSEMVVVEAPVRLEPEALERSVVVLDSARARARDAAAEAEDDGERAAQLDREAERFKGELPLEALAVPASTLVLARLEPSLPGATPRTSEPADAVRLDLVAALRGQASVLSIPASVPDASKARILAAVGKNQARLGTSRALSEALREEAKVHPSALLVSLSGSPGLDEQARKTRAVDALSGARKRATSAITKGEFAAAVPALRRWIRLMREAGEEQGFPSAYGALVGILSDRLSPPQYARAAEEQAELIRHLEARPNTPANRSAALMARLDLGTLKGRGGDAEGAESELRRAHAELTELGDRLGAARALYELAQHYSRDREDYRQAAVVLEQAIAAYEREKAFEKKPTPEYALRAVRSAGVLYLNRLSDPVRARAAYERAYRYADGEDERLRILIDLSRVARRAGDFAAAAERVEEARLGAAKSKRVDLEISALTEAANIAWYQGDYRRGQDLCTRSLTLIDTIKPDKPSTLRAKRRSRIYALSVCGVLAMSRREFSTAKEDLERARRIAESLADKPEIATQYNNLGRVFLEFGRVEEAIESFQAAYRIDEALKDRFALAYDLRNLGTAFMYEREHAKAEDALTRGLQYAIEAQDTNNELRSRFALGELARERGQREAARGHYAAALPLAESLDVKEVAWQIHRALGLLARQDGRLDEAESELLRAVRIVRSITGRAAATDFGPQRYAAFDDLVGLTLERDRVAEAFDVADVAHRLEQSELLEDGRITFADREVPKLVRAAREVRSATVAAAALARLESREPQVARMLRPTDRERLRERVPEDAAIVFYRVADEALFAFVVDASGVQARRVAITARELSMRVREFGKRLTARADLTTAGAALSEVLIEPIRPLISDKGRLAIVPHRALYYVPFAALPLAPAAAQPTQTASVAASAGPAEVLLDRFVIVSALDVEAAQSALAAPLGPLGGSKVLALGAPTGPGVAGDAPLPFARREVDAIQEVLPSAEAIVGSAVTKAAFLDALVRARGVLHFAGHSRLGATEEGRASFVDPMGSELRAADGPVSLFDVLQRDTRAELVVLSSCSSLLARTTPASEASISGEELLSLAAGFTIAGARQVLATTMHVNDVAAAMLMKRFYREARTQEVARALREAQRVVRERFPHAAWWATYTILAGS